MSTMTALQGDAAARANGSAREEAFLRRVAGVFESGAWEDVGGECKAFLKAEGDHAPAHFLRSLASFAGDDWTESLRSAEKAFALDDNVKEYADLLAVLYALVGRLRDSLYYAKLSLALPSLDVAAAWGLPEGFPTLPQAFLEISEHPLLQRAFEASESGRWAEAEHWFSQHVEMHPESREGYLGLTHCLIIQEKYRPAIQALRAARHVLPDDAEIASRLAEALAAVGSHPESQACHRSAMAAAKDDPVIHAKAVVDLASDPGQSPSEVVSGFQNWGRRFGLASDAAAYTPKAVPKERLTVGYVIGGLKNRCVLAAAASVIARHRQKRFRTVGFGYGRLEGPANMDFQKAFGAWHDVKDMDPFTFRSIVVAEEVDILVDLSGFTSPGLLVAFGDRMAPVQISWLGSPCGTGLEGMDVLFTDAFLEDADVDPSLFREKRVPLAHGKALVQLPPPSERAAASDRDGLTFAADATLKELNPETVEAWARILHGLPGASLILKDHDFRSDENVAHLVAQFGNFGLAHRVDVVSERERSDFFRGADVCLLPLPAWRPEVAIDALNAGLPAICLAGLGDHARIVSGALHHLGLGADLVASTPEAYSLLALDWAADESRRKAFGDDIRERLETSAFFDHAARAEELESLYEDLWRESCNGGLSR